MDVQPYLADEPVLACPPSVGYRFRKFARRNRGRLVVAALVLFFLVLLGRGVGWAVRGRAAREAEAAQRQAARQGKVAGKVESIFIEVDRLEDERKWPEALAAARRAEAAVAGGAAEAATTERKAIETVFGNKLATTLPVRLQRDSNANRCGIAGSRFDSLAFQRQRSVTPMRRGAREFRFES
jgi:hypothetical protein